MFSHAPELVGVRRWGKNSENVCIKYKIPRHYYVPTDANLQLIRESDGNYIALRLVVDSNDPPSKRVIVPQTVQPATVQPMPTLEERVAILERRQQEAASMQQGTSQLPPPLLRPTTPAPYVPQFPSPMRGDTPYFLPRGRSVPVRERVRFPPSGYYSRLRPATITTQRKRRATQEIATKDIESLNVVTKRLRGMNFELDRLRHTGQTDTPRFLELLESRDKCSMRWSQLKGYFPETGDMVMFYKWRDSNYEGDPERFREGGSSETAIDITDTSPPQAPTQGIISPAEHAFLTKMCSVPRFYFTSSTSVAPLPAGAEIPANRVAPTRVKFASVDLEADEEEEEVEPRTLVTGEEDLPKEKTIDEVEQLLGVPLTIAVPVPVTVISGVPYYEAPSVAPKIPVSCATATTITKSSELNLPIFTNVQIPSDKRLDTVGSGNIVTELMPLILGEDEITEEDRRLFEGTTYRLPMHTPLPLHDDDLAELEHETFIETDEYVPNTSVSDIIIPPPIPARRNKEIQPELPGRLTPSGSSKSSVFENVDASKIRYFADGTAYVEVEEESVHSEETVVEQEQETVPVTKSVLVSKLPKVVSKGKPRIKQASKGAQRRKTAIKRVKKVTKPKQKLQRKQAVRKSTRSAKKARTKMCARTKQTMIKSVVDPALVSGPSHLMSDVESYVFEEDRPIDSDIDPTTGRPKVAVQPRKRIFSSSGRKEISEELSRDEYGSFHARSSTVSERSDWSAEHRHGRKRIKSSIKQTKTKQTKKKPKEVVFISSSSTTDEQQAYQSPYRTIDRPLSGTSEDTIPQVGQNEFAYLSATGSQTTEKDAENDESTDE